MGRTRGRVSRQVRTGIVPEGIMPLETHQSPPLADIVRDINKFSNNTAARQLYLALGLATVPHRRRVRGGAGTSATSTLAAHGELDSILTAHSTAWLDNSDNRRATLEKSAMAIRRWLASRRYNFPELVIENGSGLSRAERISAGHLGAFCSRLSRARSCPSSFHPCRLRRWTAP